MPCRNSEDFDEDDFNKNSKLGLGPIEDLEYSLFQITFTDVSETWAPLKIEILQAASN